MAFKHSGVAARKQTRMPSALCPAARALYVVRKVVPAGSHTALLLPQICIPHLHLHNRQRKLKTVTVWNGPQARRYITYDGARRTNGETALLDGTGGTPNSSKAGMGRRRTEGEHQNDVVNSRHPTFINPQRAARRLAHLVTRLQAQLNAVSSMRSVRKTCETIFLKQYARRLGRCLRCGTAYLGGRDVRWQRPARRNISRTEWA